MIWLLVLLSAGYWAEQKFRHADACCYTAAGRLISGWPGSDYAQLHSPGEPVYRETVILPRVARRYPPVHYVAWNVDMQSGYASPPLPKMQELATLLHCLSAKLGVKSVAVSTPLVWEDEQSEMAGLMLQQALSGFRHVGIGVSGRSAPQSLQTPELLHAAVIPAAQVSGDASGLPAANTPQPFSLPGEVARTALSAPDHLEDEALVRDAVETRGLSLPLLLRWNGEVMAALPLRLALAELGLSPADVHVRLGKSLRIGDRLLPLDAHGRTPLGAAQAVPLEPGEALTAYMPLPEEARLCAVVCRPFAPQPVDARAEKMAATLSLLFSRGYVRFIPTERVSGGHLYELTLAQTSLTGRLGTVTLLLALLLALPRLPKLYRRLALLALLGAIFWVAWRCALDGIWMSICAWLICWALLALSLLHLAPRERVVEPTLW